MPKNGIDRYRGCLLGLAVGDALGAPLEFQEPGTFTSLTDMTGGGIFGLEPGQWTDDTSMALCLAESLIECNGFNETDQIARFLRWYREGHLSSTGNCFDIGDTIREALERYERTGDPFAGPTEPDRAGNGSIMRLAPVPLAFADTPCKGIHLSGKSSRTTHGALAAIDTCRLLGQIIISIVNGAGRKELFSGSSYQAPEGWKLDPPLVPEVQAIADGSFQRLTPPKIRGTGYAVKSLEAALWAFYHSTSFQEGARKAVNLGDDADTTGAVYGQIAGAFYGESGIPKEWKETIARKDLILQYADRLYGLAWGE
ncbi:MAG: ADP-ribosylglycohydrolase family protein [Deltaproteobacteria bacterium]|nr:ADP-ribosylglycohydrolase family protein [Deltaproteobacteria bacterium]